MIAFALLTALTATICTTPTRAQTLDEMMGFIFNGTGCDAVGILPFGATPNIGPNLSGKCTAVGASFPPGAPPPPPISGGAQGGGAAQSAAIKRRLKKAKDEEEEDQSAQIASLAQTSAAEESFADGRGALFVSADFDLIDRIDTRFEGGYDSTNFAVTAGFDYRFSDTLVAGIAANLGRIEGNFTGQGRFYTASYGTILYASYLPFEGFFADLSLGYARKRFEVSRVITGVYNGHVILNGITASETGGNEASARLLLGKDFSIERFRFGPRAGLNYVFTHIEETKERGNTGLQLVYDDREQVSIQSVAGVEASMAISTGIGVVLPQVTFEWVHEFRNEQHSIDVRFAEDLRPDPAWFSFQTERPDRDFFDVRVGASLQMTGGTQIFAEFRRLLGHAHLNSKGFAAGFRLEL